MKQYLFPALMTAVGIFAILANWQSSSTPNAAGLQIHRADKIKGKTTINNHQLSYQATETAGRHELVIEIDDFALEAQISYQSLQLHHKSNQAKLTENQKDALHKWVNRFAATLLTHERDTTTADFTLLDHSLLMSAEYWSQAPPNYAYPNKSVEPNSLVNNGLTCIQIGKFYHLVYDDKDGNVFRRHMEAGINNCKGRCGRSCADNWFQRIFTVYALDCFEHDICIVEIEGGDYGADPNCGDEFWNAADDFLFGRVINGCNGKKGYP